MEISDVISQRNLKSLVHFTRLDNLDNILKNGIIPRASLDNKSYVYNDDYRYDNKLDYSCFSISFPNNEMLYRLRKNNENSHWAILILSSNILLNYDCLFYPCNAASNSVRHEDIESFKGEVALENMFYSGGRDSYLTNEYPTDVQAEVLIKGIISPEYIVFVFLDNESLVNQYKE